MRETEQALLPLSACEICRQFPGGAGANYVKGEALPQAVFRLRGMEGRETPETRATRDRVYCPLCDTEYAYEVETEVFEVNVYLTCLGPRGGFPSGDELRDGALLENLRVDMVSDEPSFQEYAGRRLARYLLGKGDVSAVVELLASKEDRALMGVVYGIYDGATSLLPLIPHITPLLFHDAGVVRGAVSACLIRSKTAKRELKKFAGEIVRAIGDRPLNSYSCEFLAHVHKRGIVVTRAIPILVRFLCSVDPDEVARPRAHELTLALARGRKRDARIILRTLDDASGPHNRRKVSGIRRVANATLAG